MAKVKGVETITYHQGMQEKFTRSNVDVAFAGGTLSPQDPDSSILTPRGFVKFRDIQADDVICGIGNSLQKVSHVTQCGKKDFIKITLEDGTSARSAMEHKWWALKDGQEMTAIGFELLESFQISKEKGIDYPISLFRCPNGNAYPVRIKSVEDIGQMDAVCIGVTNEDELYITDDYIVSKNCGKAQPYTSRIMTPKGWTTMGALKEGDFICNTEGGTQRVLRIYEKGYRLCYNVCFEYGTVRTCREHLWEVVDMDDQSHLTISTEKLAALINVGNYAVACPKPIKFGKRTRKLPIEPYMFGRLLAYGFVNKNTMSKSTLCALNKLGIKTRMSIPDRYLFGSIEERKLLLKGFIDDARFDKSYKCEEFVTVTVRNFLSSPLGFIVRSLGGDMYCKPHMGQFVAKIYMPNMHDYCDEMPDVERVVYRKIKRIYQKGAANMRCILVSSRNHLYITDSFIPTHNTFAAILSVAEPSLDPLFRAAFTRRNLGNLKQGGGIIDDFKRAYGDYVKITTSDQPRVTFPSGAFVDCLHIADETKSKLSERAKGWQYDMFYMDELTSYEFSTFSIVGTRNRGKGKWTGKIRGTTNPKRSHWTRKMLDWYIGYDGFVRKDRDGVVTYFYQMGDTVDDIVFGTTKREVYEICKAKIDDQLKKLHGKDWTYENLIRSFVFYSGKMSENKAVIGNNPSYVASVAAVGGKMSEQYIEGNFNVDDDDDEAVPIPIKDALKVFNNDPCRNGDLWISVDLADVGKDNLVGLAWDGFHVIDCLIISDSTPRVNYEKIKLFAAKHKIPDTHVIYDATHGTYMMDYMPEAIPFVSAASPIGQFALLADRLKDECYLRLVNMITNQRISIEPSVAKRRYVHKGLSEDHTIQAEFLDECSVVRLHETPRGRKKLLTKKDMNALLGKGRSMDLLDPFAMRMLPVLKYQYGDELDATSAYNPKNINQEKGDFEIYDDASWC